MLNGPIVLRLLVPDPQPKQYGAVTLGQISCSGTGSGLSLGKVAKSACPLQASLI